VIGDLKIINPWDPRGLKIYGIVDTVDRKEGYMSNTNHPQSRYIQIKPTKNGIGELMNLFLSKVYRLAHIKEQGL
jgi:hypothetical protein